MLGASLVLHGGITSFLPAVASDCGACHQAKEKHAVVVLHGTPARHRRAPAFPYIRVEFELLPKELKKI